MKNRLTIAFAVLCLGFANISKAQLTKDSVKAIFNRINNGYDSAKSIRFDVTLRLSSDTVKGLSESDVTKVSYIMDGRNVYYANELAEFMQTDSISLTVMLDEKVMYLTSRQGNAGFFPGSSLDSVFLEQVSKYQSYETILTDGTHKLEMVSDSPEVKYSRIAMQWDTSYYVLISSEFDYKELASQNDPYTYDEENIIPPTEPPVLNKHIVLSFENYRLNEDDSVFDLTKYFYYDYGKREFIAKGKYAGFQLLSSNIDPENNPN